MSTTDTDAKNDRLEARTTAEPTARVVRTASTEGRSLTDVVVSSTAADEGCLRGKAEPLEFSARDQLAFAESLTNPPAANEALRSAARRYLSPTRATIESIVA
jgi:uncharacterized protein (DUF1778 family)